MKERSEFQSEISVTDVLFAQRVVATDKATKLEQYFADDVLHRTKKKMKRIY